MVTTYGYDTLNRLKDVTYNTTAAPGVVTTPNVTYSYETLGWGNGQLQSVSVGSFYQATNTYDQYGRVTSVAHNIEGRSYTSGYHYNGGGQPRQIAHMYPEYDSTGRLNSIKDSQGGWVLSSASYNIAGQVTASSLLAGVNAVNESFSYDGQRLQLATQTATRAGTTLMSLTYSFQAAMGQMGAGTTPGNAGQLMSVSGTIGGQTESASYTYDLVGRLATSSQTTNATSAQRQFSYDRWGNRTGVWDATSGGSQIQSVSLLQSGGAPTNQLASVTTSGVTKNYTYDSAGNVTNDGSHTYVYDAENRVASVDSGAYTYGYDHQNRRLKKSGGGAATHYLWQGSQVIVEYNGSTGTVQVEYYYAGSKLIAKQEAGQRRYYLSDRLSLRFALDGSGNVVGRQGHLPFGEDVAASGEQDKHHFTSYQKDVETGLDYAVNRYDSVSTARFTTVDPKAMSAIKELPQTWNRYIYTANDPINRKDPWGLDFFFGQPGPALNPCDRFPFFGTVVLIDGFDFYSNNQCISGPLTVPEPIPGTGSEPAPSCSIDLNFLGPFSADNHIRIPAYLGPERILGPRVVDRGWVWLVEIFGFVSDDVSTWTIGQSFTGRSRSVIRRPDGSTYTEDIPISENRDAPERSDRQQPQGGRQFFFIDAPGHRRKLLFGYQVISVIQVQNFTTWIQKGKTRCELKWHVKIEVRDGTIYAADVGYGHISTDF